MTGFQRAKRASDFDMMQVLPAVVLVAVMLIGGDWVGETTDEADAQRARQGEALTVAMQQVGAAMAVDFDRLELTAGFVPMALTDALQVADMGGAAPSAEDSEAGLDYAVEMRITALDAEGRIRKVEVRVGYAVPSGERVWVETATVRQDWDGLRAIARRNVRPTHG